VRLLSFLSETTLFYIAHLLTNNSVLVQ
jgi:hypothetical protein